ncbi:MAG: type II toxin-antitoxin system VapC family toxin [Acidimicrobiales bacterium]
MILLDTHALLWWKAGGGLLSAEAATAISQASVVLISPVSCWEVATLVRKGRIGLDRPIGLWTTHLFADERVEQAPLSPAGAARAGSFDAKTFHADPADRLIYATAAELRVPLVTRDRRLKAIAASVGDVRILW